MNCVKYVLLVLATLVVQNTAFAGDSEPCFGEIANTPRNERLQVLSRKSIYNKNLRELFAKLAQEYIDALKSDPVLAEKILLDNTMPCIIMTSLLQDERDAPLLLKVATTKGSDKLVKFFIFMSLAEIKTCDQKLIDAMKSSDTDTAAMAILGCAMREENYIKETIESIPVDPANSTLQGALINVQEYKKVIELYSNENELDKKMLLLEKKLPYSSITESVGAYLKNSNYLMNWWAMKEWYLFGRKYPKQMAKYIVSSAHRHIDPSKKTNKKKLDFYKRELLLNSPNDVQKEAELLGFAFIQPYIASRPTTTNVAIYKDPWEELLMNTIKEICTLPIPCPEKEIEDILVDIGKQQEKFKMENRDSYNKLSRGNLTEKEKQEIRKKLDAGEAEITMKLKEKLDELKAKYMKLNNKTDDK